jgi:hypothetical protein
MIIAWRIMLSLGLLLMSVPQQPRRIRVYDFAAEDDIMANKTRWVSQSGYFADETSWDNGIPLDSPDLAIFDGTSQVSLRANSAVDATLDRDAAGVTHDFLLLTTPDYTGNIGQPGNPLTWLAASTDKITIRGSGTAYLKPNGANLIVDSVNRRGAVYLDRLASQLFVKRGRVFVQASCGVTNGVWVEGEQARLEIAAKAAAELPPRILRIRSGLIINQRAVAANSIIAVDGGRLEQYGDINDATDITVGQLGEMLFNPGAGGTTAAQITVDGILDVSAADDGVIDLASIVVGPRGEIKGNINPSGGSYPYIDLRLGEP